VNIGYFTNQPDSQSSKFDLIKEQFTNVNIKAITFNSENLKSTVESLFNKSNEYDIFIYSSIYLKYIAPYLSNLKQYLPKEHIDMYDIRAISEIGTFKNELVGLVNINK